MKGIDASDLRPFLAVAEHGSFRRAAVALGVTPSALSHALRGLEERLGVRLFNRTTRSVALTEAGERLLGRVGPAFRDIHAAIEDLDAFRGAPAGTLRLNAARVSTRMVLLPVVTRFMRAYPDVRVELVAEEGLVDVVAGGFDAGVRFGERIAADMIAVPIGPRQRSAVVAAPELFTRCARPTTPHELRGLPCIRMRFAGGAVYRWEFERAGAPVEVEVDGPLTLGDQDLIVDAALAGVGLAYLFEGQVERELADGRLVRVLGGWCPSYPGFYLYYPGRRQLPPTLRAFIEFVRAEGRATG